MLTGCEISPLGSASYFPQLPFEVEAGDEVLVAGEDGGNGGGPGLDQIEDGVADGDEVVDLVAETGLGVDVRDQSGRDRA